MKGSEEQPPGSGSGRFRKVISGEEEKVTGPAPHGESRGRWMILTGTWHFLEQGKALVISCDMWVGSLTKKVPPQKASLSFNKYL